MRGIRYVLLLTLLHYGTIVYGQKTIDREVRVDGLSRSYILYLPANLPTNSPLVFVFHGYTGSAASMVTYTKMNDVADVNKFAVCYPQGLKDQNNNTFWEVGYSWTSILAINDLNFTLALASELQQKYSLSSSNTFACGHSNGGDMSIFLACKAPSKFKAVAAISGSLMKVTYNQSLESAPIPVFMLNGTADKTTWWDGDITDNQGYGAYLSVKSTFKFFSDKNRCTKSLFQSWPNSVASDSSFIKVEKQINGVNGNQVWLYTVENGGHPWPLHDGANMDIDATEEIWNFFKNYLN